MDDSQYLPFRSTKQSRQHWFRTNITNTAEALQSLIQWSKIIVRLPLPRQFGSLIGVYSQLLELWQTIERVHMIIDNVQSILYYYPFQFTECWCGEGIRFNGSDRNPTKIQMRDQFLARVPVDRQCSIGQLCVSYIHHNFLLLTKVSCLEQNL